MKLIKKNYNKIIKIEKIKLNCIITIFIYFVFVFGEFEVFIDRYCVMIAHTLYILDINWCFYINS